MLAFGCYVNEQILAFEAGIENSNSMNNLGVNLDQLEKLRRKSHLVILNENLSEKDEDSMSTYSRGSFGARTPTSTSGKLDFDQRSML
jgi:hypothetical protein